LGSYVPCWGGVLMADDKPTTWSLSNQTIGNKETQVDKRLTTITPQNTTGFVPLNPNSNDRLVKELEYRIRTDGIIEYRVPSLNNRQFNNIQEIANAGFPGYNNATTLKIKDDLTKVLRKETDNKILKGTGVSPFAQTPTPTAAAPGADPELKLTEAENNNFEIKTKGVRKEYGNMIYPSDLSSQEQKQDVVKFTMVSYGTRKIEGLRLTQREFNNDKNEEKRINGSVVLGIQPRISDSNSVRWNEQNMDVFSIGLAGASLNTIEGGFTGTKESITQIGQAFQQEGSNVTGALKIYFAQAAAKTQNLLSRLQGGILNPNLELLFESPELRTFNYSFQLSPREPKEAQEIKKIIRFFKQGMAVQRSEAELFLKAPNVFEIKYLLSNGERDHPYLNKIKKCALVNCGVDYTPTGSYMTFAGAENSMVTYNLSLTFRELEPIYADDYDNTYNEILY
jgi:hypothetical protein